MRILFVATGTATRTGAGGALEPFVRAAARAGHDVLVAGPGLAARAVRAAARPRLSRMLAAAARWRPDVIVGEGAELSSRLAAEWLGVPHARVAVGLSTSMESAALERAAPALDELRATIGLAPDPGGRRAREAPCLTMAPRVLDDRSAPEPPWVHRFRAPRAQHPSPPVPRLPDGDEPLVLVSFGTEVPSPTRPWFPAVYLRAIEALAELPVRALITVGDRRDPADLGPLPASIRAERRVPQAAVMPDTAAMVCHGGAGTTLIALSAGVPLAVVPLFADQPLNAPRVAAVRAGIALEGGLDAFGRLGDAVSTLLSDPRYTRAAGDVAEAIAALPPVDDAIAVLAAAVHRGALAA